MELDKVLRRQAKRLRQDVLGRDSGDALRTHAPTGFRAVDAMFGGIRLGCATELMAHTGDGKSAIAAQICEATARAGGGAKWFCGEDPEEATAERFLGNETGITATEMGRLDLSPGELDRIDQAAVAASTWAQHVDVQFGQLSVEELLTAVDDTEDVGGAPLKLVVVDYIQLMASSRTLEDDIARLATGLNVRSATRKFASLLLSQVASDVLKRGRERYLATKDVSGFTPGLGDTEWCRRAEKSTKAVLALVRPNRWRREMGEEVVDDCAELHVRKANFGPMGWVPLSWDGPRCRFSDKD